MPKKDYDFKSHELFSDLRWIDEWKPRLSIIAILNKALKILFFNLSLDRFKNFSLKKKTLKLWSLRNKFSIQFRSSADLVGKENHHSAKCNESANIFFLVVRYKRHITPFFCCFDHWNLISMECCILFSRSFHSLLVFFVTWDFQILNK